jgi:hypothetical protein
MNNFNLPQVPPQVYYPPYDRPPPYNPEYYETNQNNKILILNSQEPNQLQYNQMSTPVQIMYINKNENKEDDLCFLGCLGVLCCCCF